MRELDLTTWRKEAEKYRFQAVLEGTFPRRSHAWTRTPEKQALLDRLIIKHIQEKGVARLKDGTFVLLGSFPDAVREYMQKNKEAPLDYVLH